MILRVDVIHKSLYLPFWIFNYTELKLEFQFKKRMSIIKKKKNFIF